MKSFKRCFLFTAVISLLPLLLVSTAQAEERKISKEEKMAAAESKAAIEKSGLKLRAKLTEDQAINQLKYMMVKGWARMERQLVEQKTFQPFGLTLSPQGDFKPIFVSISDLKPGENYRPEFVLNSVTETIKAVADSRSMWAVGVMYIQAKERPDGSFEQRIQVMTEHIAGWAHHWSYPFKITDGEVKLGAPIETPVKPVYFSKSK